jgi:hypothetical protein
MAIGVEFASESCCPKVVLTQAEIIKASAKYKTLDIFG